MVLDDNYNLPNFNMELKVEYNGITSNWLCLKNSGIPNSGLGIFALRAFKEKEFITAYLGKKETDDLETEYVFHGINGKVGNKYGCLMEEFWFAHQIQHGSGPAANVKIRNDYTLIALKDIKIGDELFFDYNRDIRCPFFSKKKQDFATILFRQWIGVMKVKK